ncbi:unnamed protein product [Caenorhabditis bovis]|uniref:Uncharacterized protein n=1 Tax=Caenorhabditis bovis TaxID=2654633 RepID=A0A8S1EIJ4_9PELO|nr:unnamed protein product [Caenorhabditis bovis]
MNFLIALLCCIMLGFSYDFHINTHYNGTKICKFETKNLILAAYETPEKYDINSPREEFFSNFAVNDALKISSIPMANPVGVAAEAPVSVLEGGFFG